MQIQYFPILSSVNILSMILLMSGCTKDDAPKVSFSLPSNIIHKIVTDKNGTKWIATDKGLVCFDGDKWNPYPDIPIENISDISDLSIGSATTNEIWLAGNTGVSFLKFNSNDIFLYGSFTAQENGLLSNHVSSVAADALNTRYFGTTMGLSIFKNDTWDIFLGRKTEEILRDYKISSIATAKNGWVYAATYGGGVSCFKYTDAISGATTYDTDYSQLKSNYINTVIIVDDTCQWYGTNHGASLHTSHYTKIIEDWKSYTKIDGLISDTVLSVAKDLNGNIWFGTNYGVSRLSGEQFTSFTTNDGLTNDKVNTISIDIDSSVWFGTDNGISHFKNGSWTAFMSEWSICAEAAVDKR